MAPSSAPRAQIEVRAMLLRAALIPSIVRAVVGGLSFQVGFTQP
jgi:hypothetical protein